MKQIFQAYCLPKETVASIMMFYKNTKAMVHSLDVEIDLFEMVARVFPGDILASFLFIICLEYILRTSIDPIEENGFILKNAKNETISSGKYY